MSWRGQGGRRAKGRRGDQDPELDQTAWLAELEREAAEADDDEDDWAATLRNRRSPPGPAPPAADPGWSPADPAAADRRSLGQDPPAPGSSAWSPSGAGSSAWSPDPAAQDLPAPAPADPDWSWRPPAGDAFTAPESDAFADQRPAPGPDADWRDRPRAPGPDAGWSGPRPATGPEPAWYDRETDPAAAGWGGARDDPADGGWQAAGADVPTGAWSPMDPGGHDPGYPNGQASGHPADPGYAPEPGYPAAEPGYAGGADYPVGREPDYPALFGELYRRSAGQQDPIWEAPPPAEPLPEAGPSEATTGSWPFEETTQSWEPSDRSFVWPPDELPSTSAEWDQPSPASWLDDPAPPPAPPVAAAGPPPADWAAAIPTDVPAAERAADPAAATRVWRADQAADAEPGVPLGGRADGRTGAATSRSRAAGAEAGAPFGGGAEAGAATTGSRAFAGGNAAATGRVDHGAGEPGEVRRKGSARRPAGERQARAWPRIVAIVSWIVLVMVLCWFYVFPWLERVLPESF